MLNKDREVWKTYPEFPFIEASNLGRIRTKDRWVPNGKGKRLVKGRILKQRRDRYGYMRVGFCSNGKRFYRTVHRIVATCFLPNPNNLPQVNHIDCDITNNAVSNLEWCTPEYNIAYREKYGIALNRQVIAINPETSQVLYFDSQHEASRKLSIDRRNIGKVIKDQAKTAGGFWFCIADENAVEKTREKFGDEIAKKVKRLMSED